MGASEGGGATRIRSLADMKGLVLQVLTGRWLVVFASFLVMVTAGASYMFGLYSNDIKSVLGYDQTTLNLPQFDQLLQGRRSQHWHLGGPNQRGHTPMGGLVNRCGPKLLRTLMIWLAVTEKIPKPQVWHMCMYMAIGANSHTFTNTGTVVTCVKNFPEGRGVVLGLLKGYTAISAAVIAQLYHAVYGDDTKSFVLLVAWLPTAISFAFIRTIRIIKVRNRRPNEIKTFYKFLYISLGLAAFLLTIIIVEKRVRFNQSQYAGTAAVVLFLLFLPLGVVILEEYKVWKEKFDPSPVNIVTEVPNPDAISSPTPPQMFTVPVKKDSSWNEDIFNPPEIGEDYTIFQALFSIEMLTLLLATICGLGGTMTMMDNLGQIGTSFGYPLRSVRNFVSLTSIWSFLGQIVAGIGSEMFIAKYKWPRPIIFTAILLLSCVGHLLIAFNVTYGLYVASVVTGFCFGAHWPLIYTLISELFGLKHYSTLYNFGGLASPIGLYVLNVRITGHLYDKEAKKQMASLGLQRKPGEELNCVGGECFKLSFIIISVVTFFGAIVSLVLVFRTRKFYRGDIYKKFRQEAQS